MYFRHFGFMLAAFFAVGCSCTRSHTLPPSPDSGLVAVDAGMFVWPDSGPTPVDAYTAPDAGVPDLTVALTTWPSWTDRLIAPGTAYVALAGFDFTAGAEDVALSNLVFRRTGAGSVEDFDNLYLFEMTEARVRMSSGRSINRVTHEVAFNLTSNAVYILAGHTHHLWIFADVSLSAMPGAEHTIELVSADAVTALRGPDFGPTDVIAGDFPLVGNTAVITSVIPARADFHSGSSTDIVAGERGVISRFTITADNVYIDAVTLMEAGSIEVLYDALREPELYVDGIPAGTVGFFSNSQILLDFDLPGGTGLIVRGSVEVTVTARIASTIESGRTIRNYIEYPVDVRSGDEVHLPDDSPTTARVCISPEARGGCDSAGLASFDGTTSGTYFEVTIR